MGRNNFTCSFLLLPNIVYPGSKKERKVKIRMQGPADSESTMQKLQICAKNLSDRRSRMPHYTLESEMFSYDRCQFFDIVFFIFFKYENGVVFNIILF